MTGLVPDEGVIHIAHIELHQVGFFYEIGDGARADAHAAVLAPQVCKQRALVKRVVFVRKHEDDLHGIQLRHGDGVPAQKRALFGQARGLIVFQIHIGEQLLPERKRGGGGMIGAVRSKLHHLAAAFVAIALEINAHFAAACELDARFPFSVVQQRGNRMRHALGGIVVVVVHVNDYFAARFFVHHVALFAERNLFFKTEVPHAGVLRHEVFNGIAAVINNNPFHAFARIGLMSEALHHRVNERAAVERGRAHAYHWIRFRLLHFMILSQGFYYVLGSTCLFHFLVA